LGLTAIVENDILGVDQPLRSWPSAGGLYPLDTYVVATAVDRLASGLHHYNVVSEALEQLPSASPQRILDEGFLYQDFVTRASAVVLLVAVFERTVAKYGERGYRLVLLDAGHAAENLLLAAESLGLPAVALAGFADAALSYYLGVDGVDEAVVHAVAIGGRS
jgi:SagB-type dehydrogenase family enzyme